MSRRQGKYALITGASQGLGLQTAIAFAREGVAGMTIVARGAALLEKARRFVQKVAPTAKVLAIVAAVSQPQAIERVVATTRDRTIPRLWKLRFSQSGTALIDALYLGTLMLALKLRRCGRWRSLSPPQSGCLHCGSKVRQKSLTEQNRFSKRSMRANQA